MLFENLYNLIKEHNETEALSFETLSKYYYYHVGPKEANALAINNYLKKNNINNRQAMVVFDADGGDAPYYHFLVSKIMSKTNKNKLVRQIKTLVGGTAQMRMTQYGEYPAEDLTTGYQYEFDPMGKYDLDNETKEDWRDIITNL